MMQTNVKDWYLKNFKEDKLGQRINPKLTFSEVLDGLKTRKSIYSVIGVGDSVIRERIFQGLADIYCGGDYGTIYRMWL